MIRASECEPMRKDFVTLKLLFSIAIGRASGNSIPHYSTNPFHRFSRTLFILVTLYSNFQVLTADLICWQEYFRNTSNLKLYLFIIYRPCSLLIYGFSLTCIFPDKNIFIRESSSQRKTILWNILCKDYIQKQPHKRCPEKQQKENILRSFQLQIVSLQILLQFSTSKFRASMRLK